MTPLTFWAGRFTHFARYLIPLYLGLPEHLRGEFHAKAAAYKLALEAGIPIGKPGAPRGQPLVVVASYEDHRAVYPSPTILVNHGIGQSYRGDPDDEKACTNPSYSGGRDRERVALFICPSERDAQVNLAAYPHAQAVATGPYLLDAWLDGSRPRKSRHPKWKPVVCISTHSDVYVTQETRSAFSYYQQAIIELAKSKRYTLLGHAHPRSRPWMAMFWKKIGVPYEPDFAKVLDQASVYVTDNSSTLYEAGAVGIPVVALNAPWYRREVHHGARFWDFVPGIQVDEPHNLVPAIDLALADEPDLAHLRHRAVEYAYEDKADGHALERTIAALTAFAQTYLPAGHIGATV